MKLERVMWCVCAVAMSFTPACAGGCADGDENNTNDTNNTSNNTSGSTNNTTGGSDRVYPDYPGAQGGDGVVYAKLETGAEAGTYAGNQREASYDAGFASWYTQAQPFVEGDLGLVYTLTFGGGYEVGERRVSGSELTFYTGDGIDRGTYTVDGWVRVDEVSTSASTLKLVWIGTATSDTGITTEAEGAIVLE